MVVRVLLFAVLRERAGARELELELPEEASVGDALAALAHLTEGTPVVMAVNRDYAEVAHRLAPGDELALIPPVSGGAGDDVHVRITDQPLSLDAVTARVRDRRAGAIVTFQGVTRAVDALDYEAYESMALAEMRTILAAAISNHGLCRAAAEHRIGRVPLSEPSVVIAVSAPHRDEAFAGAREAIDSLKAHVPIWKRELEGGATRWVDGELPVVRSATD